MADAIAERCAGWRCRAADRGGTAHGGLSIGQAWKTLRRAVQKLKAGDTLYLEPGVYPADVDLQAQGEEGSPVIVRGRGTQPVVIQGALRISQSSQLKFERLHFVAAVSQLEGHILDPVFADPQFAGDPGVAGNPKDKSGHAPDRMMEPGLKLDFDSFFATNPELIKQGIGLQPEAFKDFQFNAPKRP